MLDKFIMSIWCVYYGGMPWRTMGLLTGIPFTTMYSCFARWNRLGLWKGLLVDFLRRWRVTEIRRMVERSFAWLSRDRRLNTIFDRTDSSLVAFVQIAFISILSCRLHRLETAENMA